MRRDLPLAAVAVLATGLSTLALAAAQSRVPSNSWAPSGDMSQARAGAAAVLLYDGSILVTGGMDDAGVTATAERFSPTPRQFVRTLPMATPRANHTSTLLPDGRVLVAGGMGADGRALNGAELYDPAAGRWTPVGPLHWARAGHTATALNDGRVVIAGGNDGDVPLRSVEIYNPDLGAFELSGTRMRDARTGHAAALASDGTLLVTGGFDGVNILSSAEIYNPLFDSVTPGPPLSTPRIGHSATTLLTGRVLVAGGANGNGELDSAEVYDSATRGFSPAGRSMIVARQRHQALLLPHNGQVLIVGGLAGGAAVADAEVYVAWQGTGGTFYQTSTPALARVWAAASALSFVPSPRVRSGPGDGLLLLAGGSKSGAATAPFKRSELYGFATVKTDKADYAPGTHVTITGGGWVPGETVTLTLQESPGFDEHQPLTAVADQNGNIVNAEFAPDEHDLNILFYLTATGSASQAQTTFTDGRNAIAATLDGRTKVIRARAGTISADVTVTAASTNWHSTGWRIAASTGAFTCQNTPDHDSDGTFSEVFTVTAPAGVGVYNAYFAAFSDEACATSPSATTTLTNAVVVDAAVLLIGKASPMIASIDRAASSPTNAPSVSWAVTFSEEVTGVGPADFSLALSGLEGAPAITGVSGSGAAYTVTASTGTGSGTIGLNLVDDDSIVDAAGDALGGPGAGNGGLWGAAYTLDRTLTPQVTAASRTYDGTTAATIVTRTLTGSIVPGDVVGLTGGTATFETKEVGSNKTVTATGFGLTGVDAAKYVLSSTSATTTASITTAGLILTGVTVSDRPYDGTTAAPVDMGNAALVGVVAGDEVTLVTSSASGTFPSATIGTDKPVIVAGLAISGPDAGNYILTAPGGLVADITPSNSSGRATASADPPSSDHERGAHPSDDAGGSPTASASVESETPSVTPQSETPRHVRFSPSWVPIFVPTATNGETVVPTGPVVDVNRSSGRASALPTRSNDKASATVAKVAEQPGEPIRARRTAVAASDVRATFGQATAMLTAVVKSDGASGDYVDEGIVTFIIREGARRIAQAESGPVSGDVATATLSLGNIPAGSYSIDAVYEPASDTPRFMPCNASGAGVLAVAKAGTHTTVTSSRSASTGRQQVTLTAVVRPETGAAPTGSVAFFNDRESQPVASAECTVVDGRCVATVIESLRADAKRVTAVYAGDANFGGSRSAVSPVGQVVRSTKSAPALDRAARPQPVDSPLILSLSSFDVAQDDREPVERSKGERLAQGVPVEGRAPRAARAKRPPASTSARHVGRSTRPSVSARGSEKPRQARVGKGARRGQPSTTKKRRTSPKP